MLRTLHDVRQTARKGAVVPSGVDGLAFSAVVPPARLTPLRECLRGPAPPQEHRVDDPGVTSPSRPLQIGRAKMGGRGRAEGSEGTPGRKKRRQKQGSPPQVGDEITTELDSYSLLEPIGEDTERELATFHLLVSSAASERTQECAS